MYENEQLIANIDLIMRGERLENRNTHLNTLIEVALRSVEVDINVQIVVNDSKLAQHITSRINSIVDEYSAQDKINGIVPMKDRISVKQGTPIKTNKPTIFVTKYKVDIDDCVLLTA